MLLTWNFVGDNFVQCRQSWRQSWRANIMNMISISFKSFQKHLISSSSEHGFRLETIVFSACRQSWRANKIILIFITFKQISLKNIFNIGLVGDNCVQCRQSSMAKIMIMIFITFKQVFFKKTSQIQVQLETIVSSAGRAGGQIRFRYTPQ